MASQRSHVLIFLIYLSLSIATAFRLPSPQPPQSQRLHSHGQQHQQRSRHEQQQRSVLPIVIFSLLPLFVTPEIDTPGLAVPSEQRSVDAAPAQRTAASYANGGLFSLRGLPADAVPSQSGGKTKVVAGGASTLDQGRATIITRGVNLEGSDFSGQDLSGVSFQQSVVRNSNFAQTKLLGASFFDADLANADFTGANMKLVNLELANLRGASFRDAIVTEAYTTGSTSFGENDIENADFSETFLRKDQQKYLCGIAKGTNAVTGVATADSLNCP
ncbi:unnamed protein product [Vitrella brassicaformis CCMP3155]|uniref:Pentapeptide repeat protein n=1 Tax=Vitrella brassicaformis (strain CCMP3155) TaxID=1169540 RepID=A0A0G4FW43_VITBC|nr:unnamed protein product [Vitrella brassicaformis CCMP3155]|eukprot:CEM19210.1 unnamed protein product [Vitrella brassicaformis CCMP3155]